MNAKSGNGEIMIKVELDDSYYDHSKIAGRSILSIYIYIYIRGIIITLNSTMRQ